MALDGSDDLDAERELLRHLEDRRCCAISDEDLPMLRAFLDRDLVHVHANGRVQDMETYLRALALRPRTTTPLDCTIRFVGPDTAIMTGTLRNARVAPDGASVTGDIHALRVWRRADETWLLTAFAASPLGDRP